MPDDTRDSPTPTTSAEWRLDDARKFVGELAKLRDTDRGRMADLRRNAGNTLPGRNTAWFYQYLYSPHRRRRAEVYYLVATLYDLNRSRTIPGDLGRAMQALAQRVASDAARRRFHLLLDAEFDRIRDPFDEEAPWQDGGGELAYRLRQTVRLLASKEIGIDWAQLLVDLCWWSHPDRRIQKKWARSFFGAPIETEEATTQVAQASQ